MDRSPVGWAIAGALIGLIAALVVFAPASWLAQQVALATGERVQLRAVLGSVWTGSAELVLGAGPGSRERSAMPGRVSWSLRPAWDGLRLRLHADCCARDGIALHLQPGWATSRVSVADHASRWSASVLQGLGAPWNTIDAQGELTLRSQGLSLEWSAARMVVQGQLQVDALGMSSRLSTLRPIGSYRLLLHGGGTEAAPVAGVAPAMLTLETLEGSLVLKGSGQQTATGWRFRGEAQATPQTEAALSNLLNIVGRRRGAGSMISIG